jgi:hypothetical protein
MPKAEPIANVEVSFNPGQLRQPGLWGKVCEPDGAICEYDADPAKYDLAVERQTRKITFPSLPEGTYLVWGFKGFHAAGTLSVGYVLLQVKKDQKCEWQMPGHLARFEGNHVLLINQSETDLEPIYQSLRDAKYADLARLQNFLRREKKDTSAAPPPKT